jgi:hypothetical protein
MESIFITSLLLFIAFVFIMRYIGAWMFRINELIRLQKEMNEINYEMLCNIKILIKKITGKDN